MKALITGINGFVGKHLSSLLEKENFEVIGVDKQDSRTVTGYHNVDINDRKAMPDILRDTKPDHIYHLAAPAFIPDSYDNPMNTFESIIFGTVNLLEAVRQSSPNSKLLFVGSSDEYGPYEGIPFREDMLPNPCSPYASAKLSASIICGQYAALYDVNVIRTRSFNHMGPGQSPRFVSSNMASQIASVEKRKQNEITLGNLNTSRDFLDVRDVVRAYYMIMCQKESAGQLYNVCSGTQITIRYLLDSFLSLTGLVEGTDFDIRSDDQYRRFDNHELCGDNSKISSETGWVPNISYETTINDIMNYWREQ